jgi:hypothetical protein
MARLLSAACLSVLKPMAATVGEEPLRIFAGGNGLAGVASWWKKKRSRRVIQTE